MKILTRIRTALMTLAICAAICPSAWAGYDLHITRAKQWADSKTTPVPVEEWIQYVKSDSEFRLVQPKDAKAQPKDAVWIDPKTKQECYFYYSDGEISVKNPSESIIAKMKKVALKLKAKVVGDEDEDYK